MLVLLRSDHERPFNARQAFLELLRKARVKTDNIFEVPLLQAPQPNAILIRLRKLQPVEGMVIVMGTGKDETLAQTIDVLRELRKRIPYLAVIDTLIIARSAEWSEYREARPGIECFEVPDQRVLVVEQRESYSELTHRMLVAYFLPKKLVPSTGKSADSVTTQQFMLGERPTGSMARITDEDLARAGITVEDSSPGLIERGDPTAEIPLEIDPDRTTELPPPPDFKSK
jgi:hypothetical protein